MSLTGESPAQFSELEPEELEEYRPLNRPAVISLVLGFLSPIALFHPVFCLIPAFGGIFALVALRQLRHPDLRQSGHAVAVLGLMLSLLFVSWSIARQSSRQNYLYGKARVFGESWLELVRKGEYLEAHQLTLQEGLRIERGASLEKHYEPKVRPSFDEMKNKSDPTDPGAADEMLQMMEPSPRESMDGFFSRPTVKRVRDLGETAKYRFLANLRIGTSGQSAERIELLYEASGKEKGIPITFNFVMALERSSMTGPGDWRVETLAEAQGK